MYRSGPAPLRRKLRLARGFNTIALSLNTIALSLQMLRIWLAANLKLSSHQPRNAAPLPLAFADQVQWSCTGSRPAADM
jgi:hypothetical protein